MADDQQQDSSQELDPIQQMIQQALASQQDQTDKPANYVMADAQPAERPTLGERIGAKPPAMIQPARPSPAPAPSGNIASPGATDVLKPVTDSLANKTVPAPPVSNWGNLLSKQADYGKPLDRNAIDASGKKIYKMGWGQRLAGGLADAAAGFNGKAPPIDISPGATNRRYAIDEAARQANLGNINTQIGSQKDLAESNRKLYEAATQGESRETLGKVAEMKANVDQQVADMRDIVAQNTAKYNEEKTDATLKKIAELSQHNDDMLRLGQGNLDLKQRIGDLAMSLREQQLANKEKDFTTGTDAKSLEAERKEKIAAINNEWNKKTWLAHVFGSPQKEIDAVNADINARLAAAKSGQVGATGAPQAKAAPQTHVFSKSAWSKANPGKDANAAAAMAKKQGFQVNP